MEQRKKLKVLLSVLVILGSLLLFPLNVFATQSRTENFDKSYSLGNNQVDNLVNVAQKQIGKRKSELGYTEAWCADFVCDCAKLTGMANNIIPYNYGSRGACTSLYNYMLNNCSARSVSSREKGDIIFYYCSGCGRYVHTGIVLDGTYSIEGNYGGKVTKVQNSYTDSAGHKMSSGTITRRYLRPNYGSNSHQSNHNPYGCLDSCSGGAGVVNISGWAKDDDAPDQGVELHVYIGGPVGSAEGEGHGGIYANKHRSDVGNHAYSETIKTNKTGRQEIYIYGINIGGGTNPLIATGTVNIDPAYHNPVGFLDSCSGGKGVVNISGWTKDDDAPDAGLDIHVYIGGSAGSGVSPQGFRADKYRSDVGKHAFWETIKTNKTGVQEVYVYAINVGGGGNTLIGKGTVTIDPAEIRGSEMSSGYNRVLPDGDYLIASAANPQYYLDIQGSAVPAANNTNVALCGPLSGEPPVYEIWTITYTNGFYRISQKGAGVSLDVYGADTLQGQNVQVYGNSSSSAQKWAISRNNRNGYRIQAKCSGYSLDINNGTIANGTNVHQYSGNDSAAQEWIFIPYKPSQDMQNGRYIILTDLDRTVEVDVPGDTGDVPNEANIQLWKDTALSRYNSFDITKLSNGYYKIIHAASGKALDLYGGGTALGSNISLHDANGSTAQQWAITNAGGDSFIVWARCSGMVMDVDHAKTANGTNIAQHTYSGWLNQKWHFVKAEYPVTYDLMGGQGNPEKQTKYYKSALKLSSSVPTRTGYIFKGWSDSKNSGGSVYAPGSTYTKDADLRLYAVWEKDPVPVLSVSQNAGILIAAVSNMDYVKEYGFVYAKGSNVTLEIPGRTRIAYSKVDSSGRYSFDATELTGCTIRAYAVYTDKDGITQVIYSDPISQ